MQSVLAAMMCNLHKIANYTGGNGVNGYDSGCLAPAFRWLPCLIRLAHAILLALHALTVNNRLFPKILPNPAIYMVFGPKRPFVQETPRKELCVSIAIVPYKLKRENVPLGGAGSE